MDDIVDVGMCGEDFVELGFVGDVAGVVFGSLAADEFDAVEDFGGGVVEVVDDDDFVVCFEEREGGEGADVASATSYMLDIVLSFADGCMCKLHIPSDKDRSYDHSFNC